MGVQSQLKDSFAVSAAKTIFAYRHGVDRAPLSEVSRIGGAVFTEFYSTVALNRQPVQSTGYFLYAARIHDQWRIIQEDFCSQWSEKPALRTIATAEDIVGAARQLKQLIQECKPSFMMSFLHPVQWRNVKVYGENEATHTEVILRATAGESYPKAKPRTSLTVSSPGSGM